MKKDVWSFFFSLVCLSLFLLIFPWMEKYIYHSLYSYICIYNVLIVSGLIFQSEAAADEASHYLRTRFSPLSLCVCLSVCWLASCLCVCVRFGFIPRNPDRNNRRQSSQSWFEPADVLIRGRKPKLMITMLPLYKCCCSRWCWWDIGWSMQIPSFSTSSCLPMCVVIMASTDATVMDSISTTGRSRRCCCCRRTSFTSRCSLLVLASLWFLLLFSQPFFFLLALVYVVVVVFWE